MLDDDPMLLPVFIHRREPLPHSVEKLDFFPESSEILSGEANPKPAGLVEHELHITEYIARVLLDGNVIALGPELLRVLSDGLNESELLHIARRKRPVKVIANSYPRLCHSCGLPRILHQ